MTKQEVQRILEQLETTKTRNMVLVDFSNVIKWKDSLGWEIGMKELSRLIRGMAQGDQTLRRFYYGSDYGPDTKSTTLTPSSDLILQKAQMGKFELITKPVKYIHDNTAQFGYTKKCNFDVEMAVDAIRAVGNYDTIIVFSGDGDIAYLLRYLKSAFNKPSYVFVARGHLGKELVTAYEEGVISKLLFAEDFETRLDGNRFRP